MTRSVVVGIVLLLGLSAGLCLEPDSGTAASVGAPDITGASLGANHAKPLPRVPLPDDLLRQSLPVLLVAVLALHLPRWAGLVCTTRDDPPPRRPFRSVARPRRGPPARP